MRGIQNQGELNDFCIPDIWGNHYPLPSSLQEKAKKIFSKKPFFAQINSLNRK